MFLLNCGRPISNNDWFYLFYLLSLLTPLFSYTKSQIKGLQAALSSFVMCGVHYLQRESFWTKVTHTLTSIHLFYLSFWNYNGNNVSPVCTNNQLLYRGALFLNILLGTVCGFNSPNANIIKYDRGNEEHQLPSTAHSIFSLCLQSQKPWIESTFTKRECVYVLPVSKDPHRYVLSRSAVSFVVIAMETGVIVQCGVLKEAQTLTTTLQRVNESVSAQFKCLCLSI